MTYSPINNLIWQAATVALVDVPPGSLLGQEFKQMADDNTEPDMFDNVIYCSSHATAWERAETLAQDGTVYLYDCPNEKTFAITLGHPAEKDGWRLIETF